MRLLLDANLSPRVAEALRAEDFDAVHVVDVDLLTATDDQIFDRAAEEGFVVVTADSDFGMLLAMRRTQSPSVVHLRPVAELVAEEHVALLIANLPQVAADLERGAIVSLSRTRLAIRDLPRAPARRRAWEPGWPRRLPPTADHGHGPRRRRRRPRRPLGS